MCDPLAKYCKISLPCLCSGYVCDPNGWLIIQSIQICYFLLPLGTTSEAGELSSGVVGVSWNDAVLACQV